MNTMTHVLNYLYSLNYLDSLSVQTVTIRVLKNRFGKNN